MSDQDSIPSPSLGGFAASEIKLYGVNLAEGKNRQASVKGGKNVLLTLGGGSADTAIIAAYGYAYQGHCYRFDAVKLMIFKSDMPDGTELVEGQNACGFEPPYRSWDVSTEDEVLDLGAQFSTFEKLTIDGNRPGRRPPNTYRSEMLLAHRKE